MVEEMKASEEGRIITRIEPEVNMRTWSLKGMLVASLALVALAVQPLSAAAGGHEGDGFHVAVLNTPTVYIAADPGTCDPSTFLPAVGQPFCMESLTGTSDLSGDFVGALLDEISVLVYADGSANFTDYESWTGTLTGHRTGSFILLESDGVSQANGVATSKVRIVDGTGTAGLAGISGRGSFSSNPNGNDTTVMTLEFPGQHQTH